MPTLIDGRPADHAPVGDRALRYGDGLFETVLWQGNRLRLWSRHLDRLHHGCERLGLPQPDAASLESDLHTLLTLSGQRQPAVFRIQLTAGDGGRGYQRDNASTPRRITTLSPLPKRPAAHWQRGIAVHCCRLRLADQPLLAGIKHCNRLEYVLARREWSDPAISEGLLLDANGSVVEGIHMNTFALHGATLLIPSLARCGVAGVMRGHLIETATALGLTVEIDAHPLDAWLRADLVFMSNALVGVLPVRRIGATTLGAGSAAARQALAALIARIPDHDAVRAAMATGEEG